MGCDHIVKKRFWDVLTHTTSPEDKESILKNGFDTSKNRWNGIFAFDPRNSVFEIGEGTIFMETDDRCKIIDLGGDRPMDNYRGVGTLEYNKIYADCAKKNGFDIPYSKEDCDWDWYTENSEDIEIIMRKFEQTECIRDILIEDGYGIVINGGEIIIIDNKCVKRMW